MLDQLVNLVRQNAEETIVKNPAVPNEANDDAIKTVASQIFDGLKGQASQGNVQDLMGMLQGGGQSAVKGNPLTSSLVSSITSNLASKFGISPQVASGIASTLIPMVMKQFVDKTNDPDDKDFDLQDVVKSITGNSNVGDILSQFTGNKQGSAGSVLGKLFK